MKYEICNSSGERIGAATSIEAEAAAIVKEGNRNMLPQDCYHYRASPERLNSDETYNFGLMQLSRKCEGY
jgi:hypothetical protein